MPFWKRPFLNVTIMVTLVFLVYSGFLVTKSVAGFPSAMKTNTRWPYLCDKPVGEDGFYMLTVAWNLAHDHQLTYTRGQTTTGIQPLSTVIFAAFAAVVQKLHGDRWMFVRLILAVGTLTCVVFSYVVSRLARGLAPVQHRDLAAELAFCLALCDFTLFRLFGYGLETGLYLVLIGVCVLYSIRVFREGMAKFGTMAVLGILVGLTGLARIDFGLIFAGFLVYMLVARRITALHAVVSGAIALAVVSPWFLFVHHVRGSWMPSSGGAESAVVNSASILGRMIAAAYALLSHVAPWAPWVVAGAPLGVKLASILLLAAVLIVALLHKGEIRAALSPSAHVISAWSVAILFVLIVYVIFFWATHFYVRYAAPVAVISIPLLAVVLASSSTIRKFRFGVPVAVAFCFCIWAIGSLHTARIGNTLAVSAGYIQRRLPNAWVGTFQSGVAGFFNPNVTNLDGKVNSDALQAAQNGRLDQYVDSSNIQVLLDVPAYFRDNFHKEYLQTRWQPCPEPVTGTQASADLRPWGAPPNQTFICLVRAARTLPQS